MPNCISVCFSDSAIRVYQIFFHNFLSVRRGEGRSPVGALPPYLPTHCYILISYTQHLPSLPQANVSATCLVSNCPIIRGILLGSMNSLTTIYFFIPLQFTYYLSERNSFLLSEVDAVSSFLTTGNLMQDILKHPQLVSRQI